MPLKRGILLVNLGSPASYSIADVREYLDEFLMDERVLDVPFPLRRLIVSCFILPFRPKKSAHAYQQIWRDNGSPLLLITEQVKQLLQERIAMPVELAMRYGRPSIEQGLSRLLAIGEGEITEVLIIPLYPHYAMATYETVLVQAQKAIKKLNLKIRIRYLPPFYEDPLYIDALVASARPYLQADDDYLLFSYHGVPERHLKKSDPTDGHCLVAENCCASHSPAHTTCYKHQVLKTTQAVVQQLQIPEGKYGVAFQSRLGVDRWLQPFTNTEIVRLARSGVKHLKVICPAFVSDCLETLEEIGIRGKNAFLKAGGEKFTLIPCLNDHPQWIHALSTWCQKEEFEKSGFEIMSESTLTLTSELK